MKNKNEITICPPWVSVGTLNLWFLNRVSKEFETSKTYQRLKFPFFRQLSSSFFMCVCLLSEKWPALASLSYIKRHSSGRGDQADFKWYFMRFTWRNISLKWLPLSNSCCSKWRGTFVVFIREEANTHCLLCPGGEKWR